MKKRFTEDQVIAIVRQVDTDGLTFTVNVALEETLEETIKPTAIVP